MSNLKWNTWIGKAFEDQPDENKILIVGESNFLKKKGGEENVNKLDFIQRNVGEARNGQRTKGSAESDFFKYILRCITGESTPDMTLYDQLAYNVVVQRPMENSSTNPNTSDFRNGLQCVFSLCQDLKVSKCLFIGLSAADHFENAAKEEFEKGSYRFKQEKEKIKGCFPRSGFIINNNVRTDFIFIRHAGRQGYKSWADWSRYLQEHGIRF